MTSRRTRIKAMANIPQRRKTANESNVEENAEEVTEHNPIFKPKSSEDNTAEIPEPAKIEEKPAENGVTAESKEPLKPPEPQTSKDMTPPSEEPTSSKSIKSVTLGRRKFIKPPVSVKTAITNRKNQLNNVEETRKDEKDPLPIRKSEKIVILDEVIAHSDRPLVQLPRIDVPTSVKINPNPVNRGDEDSLMSPPPPMISFPSNHHHIIDKEMRPPPGTFMPVQHPEGDYPIPPPSPSKLNRSRVRYTPRLGQRHASFSASESEDESRKHTRHRNDSVCSTMSGTLDGSSISECLSPQKPVEFNSVIQRKCRRSEQSRKLAEARREFYQKFGNKQPDRRKLTMIDLIFYNPTTNPMSQETKKKQEEDDCAENEDVDMPKTEDPLPETNDNDKGSDNDDNENLAPQIKIGPGGEIILDEQSLVVENKAVKKIREEIQKSKIVDGNFETGYGVYKKAKRSKDWSKYETLKFYKALNTIGTDFALMCEFFPRRDRRELKMKFKKEEKINKTLVDKALMQPCRFDFNELKHEVEMEEKQLAELEEQKERKKEVSTRKRGNSSVFSVMNKDEVAPKSPKIPRKRKKQKRKSLNILDALSDDSDADVSEADVPPNSDDEASGSQLLQGVQKPTRSGRIPKILDRYRTDSKPDLNEDKPQAVEEAVPQLTKKNLGDLMVVPSTSSTGDLVYKVFMVTGDKNNSNDNSKKGVDSIFTLTTSISQMAGDNDDKESAVAPCEMIQDNEQNNLTICEDIN